MLFSQQITPEQEGHLNAALRLAQACEYPREHTHQVTRLALRLFDDLVPLHELGTDQRFWLQCAAILHDVGWIDGEKAHHKTSLQIIQNSSILTVTQSERLIIGSIARYHRKALPSLEHDHFAALSLEEQQMVTKLAAILRVADGLDYSHLSRLRDLRARISKTAVTITYVAPLLASDEENRALVKSDLFREVFDRKLILKWKRADK